MALTLEEANRIIRGALAKAQELNIKISAAVCDSGGRLIALQRMDNAIWASAYGSQGKAVASAAFGLYRRRLPAAVRARGARLLEPPVSALKALHSGVIGDYVAWLTFGAATLGGLVVLAIRG